MRIAEGQLRRIIREELLEVTRTTSLRSGNINYDEFTLWQKSKADEVDPDARERVSDMEIQWADSGSMARVIAYREGKPIGFVVLNRFEDGHSISTLGLISAAQGGGIAAMIYDYIIGRTRLYSDVHQTPEARRLWVKLSRKYEVMGWDAGRTFKVEPNKDGTEMVTVGDGPPVYSDDEGSETRLVIPRS